MILVDMHLNFPRSAFPSAATLEHHVTRITILYEFGWEVTRDQPLLLWSLLGCWPPARWQCDQGRPSQLGNQDRRPFAAATAKMWYGHFQDRQFSRMRRGHLLCDLVKGFDFVRTCPFLVDPCLFLSLPLLGTSLLSGS